MEPTSPGDNRTGIAVSPKNVDRMLEAVRDLSPQIPISTLQMDVERQIYITEADSVGSIPPTQRPKKASIKRKGTSKEGSSKRKTTSTSGNAVELSLLLDKLGERMAFERTGTRLYSALITKYLALEHSGEYPAIVLSEEVPRVETDEPEQSDAPVETLHRIRSEELAHFRMLAECVKHLGGDPTAQTPCADVAAAASSGLMQVLTDPRTTFAQCLNTMLTAELTDNAGWELLSELAESAGEMQLVEPFTAALEAEQRHVVVIRGWLRSLLTNAAATPAV